MNFQEGIIVFLLCNFKIQWYITKLHYSASGDKITKGLDYSPTPLASLQLNISKRSKPSPLNQHDSKYG